MPRVARGSPEITSGGLPGLNFARGARLSSAILLLRLLMSTTTRHAFDAATIGQLLSKLGVHAAARGVLLELTIAGGAAIAARLGFDQTSTELSVAPYVPRDRYKRACYELDDIWPEVEDARR